MQQQLINESIQIDSSQQQQATAAARYKTELCRSYQENGTCKYGEKCQFAHGYNELRSMMRHPKYKTELCRTFHAAGYCPYGPRCHFVHENNHTNLRKSSLSPKKQQQENTTNSLLMCASDSLSREFTGLNLNDNNFLFSTSSNNNLFASLLLHSSNSHLGSSSSNNSNNNNNGSSSSSSGISSRKESTSSYSSSTEISPRSLSPDHTFGGSSGCLLNFNNNNNGLNSFGLDSVDADYEQPTQLLVNEILNNINYF